MRKSRVFIFIAALLLTLLMVVGCDVSPVSPSNNSNLVRASVAVNSSRGIEVHGGDGTITSYKIAMIPEWTATSSSDPIVGQKGSRTDGVVDRWEDVSYNADDGSISIDLGYVSQGKWSIYIAGYNASDKLIYSGSTTTYLNVNNKDVVIVMKRVGSESGTGRIGFNISVNRLNISDKVVVDEYGFIDESGNTYRMTYEIIDVNNTSIQKNYIPIASMLLQTYLVFGDFVQPVEVAPGEYSVIISLVKKDANGGEFVVGGITKYVSVYPSEKEDYDTYTKIVGNVTPSDFIQVGINFSAPEITATISCEENNGVYTFTCEDDYNKTSGYNRYYRWFIDGELVEANTTYRKWNVLSISDSLELSEMKCSFSYSGEREIHCEVVYIPEDIDNLDSDPLRFIGGVSTSIRVI